VFGAIVRISGSGMGCGDHWPKCYGSFFPPLDRPDLIIEISHRYLASIVGLLVLTLAFTAYSLRNVARMSKPKGPLTPAIGALVACLSFPLCGANPAVPATAGYVQMTHRILAILLVLHLIGTYMGLRKRRAVEAADVLSAARVAMTLGVIQILIAGAMIGMKL